MPACRRGLSGRPNEEAESAFADDVDGIELEPLGFALCTLPELPLIPFAVGTELRPSHPNGRAVSNLAFFCKGLPSFAGRSTRCMGWP